MKIDPSIFEAIDNGELTIERALDATLQVVLDHVAAECIAAGFAEAAVKFKIEELRKTRPAALETVRQMLEARATALQ